MTQCPNCNSYNVEEVSVNQESRYDNSGKRIGIRSVINYRCNACRNRWREVEDINV